MADDSPSHPQRRRSVTLIGLCVLAFVAGAIVTELESFPYPQVLERPLFALQAYINRASEGRSPENSPNWYPAPTEQTGVVRHRPARTDPGLILYASGGRSSAKLMTRDGEIVHRWKLRFQDAWSDPDHVDTDVRPSSIGWSAAHLFPDGDLLVNFTAERATPYGFGLIKIDRNSRVQWKFAARTHHDVSVADDGTIYALAQTTRPRSKVPIPSRFLESPYVLDDQIVHLSADGKLLDRFSILEAIADSPYHRILMRWFDRRVPWDRLHTNNVKPITNAFARHHDFAEPGDLLISIRSLGAIGLVDPDSGRLSWVTRGPWLGQHDPDPLPNGHLLLFDNHAHAGPDGASRILEYDPADQRVVWQYTGRPDARFESLRRGEQSLLPNGHILISEAVHGRIFEIDQHGEIVWEFHNPVRKTRKGTTYTGIIEHGLQRVSRDTLNFVSVN